MKSFKDWKNKKQYLEFSANPDAQPIVNPNLSSGLMRGSQPSVVPDYANQAQNATPPVNNVAKKQTEVDPGYKSLLDGLTGNVQQITNRLMNALKTKQPAVIMAVQQAINQAAHEILGDKSTSFARRADRSVYRTAQSLMRNSNN